jgi:hypothetical protein
MAIIINVTAGAGGSAVNGAVVQVSGAAIATVHCNAMCYVPGYAGTYSLEVEAPGFQRTQRTVTVDGTDPACGCPTHRHQASGHRTRRQPVSARLWASILAHEFIDTFAITVTFLGWRW